MAHVLLFAVACCLVLYCVVARLLCAGARCMCVVRCCLALSALFALSALLCGSFLCAMVFVFVFVVVCVVVVSFAWHVIVRLSLNCVMSLVC